MGEMIMTNDEGRLLYFLLKGYYLSLFKQLQYIETLKVSWIWGNVSNTLLNSKQCNNLIDKQHERHAKRENGKENK